MIRIEDDNDRPWDWMLEDSELRADATDGTPIAVLAALVSTRPGPTSLEDHQ